MAPFACWSAASAWSRATTVPELRVKQFLRPLQLDDGENLGRFAALERALRLLDRGFEQTLLDLVERIAFLDDVAFLEQHRVEEARYTRPDLDPIDRLDPADEVRRAGDRLRSAMTVPTGTAVCGVLCAHTGPTVSKTKQTERRISTSRSG